jgi:hypothetical protein
MRCSIGFLLLAAACRTTPDNNVGQACVGNSKAVTMHDCYLAGQEQGSDVGGNASNSGYDDGYRDCLDDHDTGSDSGG